MLCTFGVIFVNGHCLLPEFVRKVTLRKKTSKLVYRSWQSWGTSGVKQRTVFEMKKISLIFDTRPEAIKLCPLVLALQQHPDFEPHVCVTAQHRHMLDQILEVFGVKLEVDLE